MSSLSTGYYYLNMKDMSDNCILHNFLLLLLQTIRQVATVDVERVLNRSHFDGYRIKYTRQNMTLFVLA